MYIYYKVVDIAMVSVYMVNIYGTSSILLIFYDMYHIMYLSYMINNALYRCPEAAVALCQRS